ncbi:MAG TPA: hypothetical protein VLL51_04520 [Gemmatimonadales bacterium]|nr:hypothetical protein [Gemmatimonadales bacterium]
MAGPAPYDLSGTGTGFTASGRLAWRPTGSVLVVEPGLAYFRYTTQNDASSKWFLPEVSAQAEAGLGALRPFLGVGAGAGHESVAGKGRWEATLHLVAGVRLSLGRAWGLRTEARLLSVDPWAGSVVQFGFGVARCLC